jgi:hypothetical protein
MWHALFNLFVAAVVAPAAALIVIAWSGKLGWPPLLGLIVAVAAGLGIISDRIRKP